MSVRRNSPARVLAPLALVASFIALVLVVVGSTGGSNTPLPAPAKSHSTSSAGSRTPAARTTQTPTPRSTYTVRAGDNLSTISDRTGVSLEQLSALNTALDPQALISGECVNLRTKDDCH